ncbi:MAG: site-specific DNA-methyltransferase [Bacteroidota bacterium]|nr:site-specific DNA-methyltransferase [Bacteroidota bacterium]
MSRLNHDFGLNNSGFSNAENTTDFARHRWYYYKEGFSPMLVEKAIEAVDLKQNEVILDPFNGSGTTTLTAALNGYQSIGIEVNPFTAFLSKVKVINEKVERIEHYKTHLITASEVGAESNLIGFSSFSKPGNNNKWLFNDSVLRAFEGGWRSLVKIPSDEIRELFKLALITATMGNCNARRDGKCLRYHIKCEASKYDKYSFISALKDNLTQIEEDIESHRISGHAPVIYSGDCRKILNDEKMQKFKLCVTSPPYLNTFDYTDIYRPEMFLGKFINSKQELYDHRLNTVRSHVQARWDKPVKEDFGALYLESITHILEHKKELMHRQIPSMIQAYFEDMSNILRMLKARAEKNAQLWLIVSNSAYANREIPVDLIIGDIGSKAGWFLKEVGVLRHIQKRRTKYSPDVTHLRESVVIFSANK